tara:strand:+ start:385 stop:909 length:525 start_codon:yes stop_codon:yes gene_type:complete
MPDYQEGKIYKIICKETGEVYIGSTVMKMYDRKSSHKNNCNQTASKQIIERGNYEVELIENYPCNTSRELHTREQYWVDNTENTINKQRQYASEEEFKEHRKEYNKKFSEQYRNGDKREELLDKKKEYRLANLEAIKAKQSEKFTCPCGGCYTRAKKSVHFKSQKHLKYLETNA